MNANELADLVECACCAYQNEAAAMLRQQQLEIEALKNALRMKVILNEHAQQSMKGYKELLK
jgi:hypothetical protein